MPSSNIVLIRRCAWHRPYRGYPLALGVASWRGFRISFTDGICLGCSARLRRERNLPPIQAAVASFSPRGELMRAAAMTAMVVSLILGDDVRIPRTIIAPPQTVLVPPAPVEEAPTPALAVAQVPRRAKATRAASLSALRVSSTAPAMVYGAPAASYLAVTVAHTAMKPVTAPVTTPGFPSQTTFAALPHAGLTQQTA